MMRYQKASDRILAYHASGIANDVCLTGLQTQEILDIESRIHAAEYGDASRRLDGLLAGVPCVVTRLACGIASVVVDELVRDGL